MCTAISANLSRHVFGRTLDLEECYGEEIVIFPRRAELRFLYLPTVTEHSAIMGMAHIYNRCPLWYDGVNEHGVAMAALNFPHYASYGRPRSDMTNLASFEVIPFILSRAKSLGEAAELIDGVNITDDAVGSSLPPTPLHYIIADRSGAVTVEPTERGLKIYDNPVGVLTNAPHFPYHMTRLAEVMSLSPCTPENNIAKGARLIPPSGGYGAIGLGGDWSSVSRFERAVYAREYTNVTNDPIVDFFHIIDTVSVPSGVSIGAMGGPTRTVYTSAIDTKEGVYYYKTYDAVGISAVRFRGADLDGRELTRFPLSARRDVDYKN